MNINDFNNIVHDFKGPNEGEYADYKLQTLDTQLEDDIKLNNNIIKF